MFQLNILFHRSFNDCSWWRFSTNGMSTANMQQRLLFAPWNLRMFHCVRLHHVVRCWFRMGLHWMRLCCKTFKSCLKIINLKKTLNLQPKKCDIVECPGFNVLNTTSCACECEWNEENCSGPRTSLDLFDCSCVRYPCDPPWPCPEGEMIDWEVCGCVPDPDYVSKPTKLKCKPVEAEEEAKPIKNIRPHHRQ